MSSHPETASFSEFAKIANVKPSYVTQLKHDGRLVLDTTGKRARVRVAESLALIKDTADHSRRAVAVRHAAARAASVAPVTPAGESVAADAVDGAENDPVELGAETQRFQTSRAEREHWNSLTAKLDYEKSVAKVLDASQVESAVAITVTVLRSSLEQIADALTPLIAPISDEFRIRTLIADEIERALAEVARKFSALAKGEAVE